nr:josephin-1 isoform X1 [Pongo abelii]
MQKERERFGRKDRPREGRGAESRGLQPLAWLPPRNNAHAREKGRLAPRQDSLRPPRPARDRAEPSGWTPTLPAAAEGRSPQPHTHSLCNTPTVQLRPYTPGVCGSQADADGVRPTSGVTPRLGGARTAREGVSGARARRGPLTSGSGARARPRGPVGGPRSRWRPAAGRGQRARVRAFRGSRALRAPPYPGGWRAAPEAPARLAVPRLPARASYSTRAFYPSPRPCLPSHWRRGSKEMEEKERCDRFCSVLLL